MPFVPKGASVLEKPKPFVPKGAHKELDFAPNQNFGAEILGFGQNAYDGLTAPEAEAKADEVWDTAIDSGISLERAERKLPEVKEFNKRKKTFGGFVPGTGMGFSTSHSSNYDGGADAWGSIKEIWPNFKIGTVGLGASAMSTLKAFMVQLSSAYGTIFPDDSVLHAYQVIPTREQEDANLADVDAITRAAPTAPDSWIKLGPLFQKPDPYAPFLKPSHPRIPGQIAGEAFAVIARTPDALRIIIQNKQARMMELLPEVKYADAPIMAASRRIWQDGVPSMGVAVGVTMLSGSPALGLMTLGGIAKGGSFQSQIEGGGSILKASVISDLTMASEIATEQLVFPKLIKGIKGGFTVRGALTLIGENAGQEALAGFNETFLDTVGILTSKGVSYREAASVGIVEGIKTMPESALVGAGTVGVTVTTSAAAKAALKTLKANSGKVAYSPEVKEILDTRADKKAKEAEKATEAAAKPTKPTPTPVTPPAEIAAPEAAQETVTVYRSLTGTEGPAGKGRFLVTRDKSITDTLGGSVIEAEVPISKLESGPEELAFYDGKVPADKIGSIEAYVNEVDLQAAQTPETIVGVASRFKGKIFEGPTHHQTWKAAAKSVGKEDLSYSMFVSTDATYRDGFITSEGRFVTREEATKIADAAKQPVAEDEISHTDLAAQTPVKGRVLTTVETQRIIGIRESSGIEAATEALDVVMDFPQTTTESIESNPAFDITQNQAGKFTVVQKAGGTVVGTGNTQTEAIQQAAETITAQEKRDFASALTQPPTTAAKKKAVGVEGKVETALEVAGKDAPIINSANIAKAGASDFRIALDETGRIASAQEIEDYLNDNDIGAVARVQQFQKGLVGAVRGERLYRIDVFDKNAVSSSALAKQLFEQKIAPESFNNKSAVQRAIPFEERFGKAVQFAKETLTGGKQTQPPALTQPPTAKAEKKALKTDTKPPEGLEVSRKPVKVDGKTFHPVSIPVQQIKVDPKKFQFKLGAQLKGGVTEALKDVRKFDPIKGGQILVWQNKAGEYFVVDGHHRVALAKKTGFESLDTWVIREADGWTAADARATGALRNLADGKGTAVDAAKLFRDSDITLAQLKKEGVPTNNTIIQQGIAMNDLSDAVFELVVKEKLAPNMAAVIGKHTKSPAQQKQVAELIMEGEVDTVRQAELLAMTIDNAPVLTSKEQTLFGVETSEKSLFAERAKILANVEQRLKTNKKVFGVLSKQAGLIEAKGNVLAQEANIAAAQTANEILFVLEKLVNAKGPVAEALNDATKEYAKEPTKANLSKVTTELLQKWTEGPASLSISNVAGIPGSSVKGIGKEVDLFRQGGFVNVEALQKATDKMLSILEPAKLAEREVGKDVTAGVIKAAHRADVARIEFNEQEFDNLEGTVQQWGEKLGEYSDRIQNLLMLSRGTPASPKAKGIQDEALKQLIKEAPELVGTRTMINRVADFNYDFLTDVVGDKIGYVEDYFYGVYKDPTKVSNLLDYWKTTDKFTKKKKWPTYADARAFDPDIELRNPNPVENLKAEYLGIARLSGMVDLFNSLKETGEFIKGSDIAPPDWGRVHDPVFDGFRVSPSLARMINSLISTNKITRQPTLNTIRQANNLLRNFKFIGSLFHLGVIVEQSIVDTGIREVLLDPTAGLKAFTTLGFKASDPIFNTPEYKQYIENGGGHRYSIESDAQKSFRKAVNQMNKAGSTVVKGVGLPITIAERITEWMFESYIPKIKYMKYLLNVRVQEQKLKRSITDAERQEIIKEGQNFYGEMNERLFGRSGTMTTLLRFKFMAPGWFEGNLRTVLKAATQWGQSGTYNAHRSRRNIANALTFGLMVGTVGTLIMTGKPPKMPEKLEDIPDLFKIDTGKVDAKGNRIMIETMKTAKDYWLLTGNIVKGAGPFIGDAFKRFGGMTAVSWDVMSDINQMSQGKAVYDWKGDRVVEITDPFIERVLKLTLHELEKTEPIPLSVFQQARQKGMDTMLAAAMALSGVRLTKTEQAKREQEVISKIFSLRDQQEALYYYLGKLDNPRKKVKDYNKTVMRILDNPNTPPDFREEYEEKLIIDIDRLVSNKVYALLSEQAQLAEKMGDMKAPDKEITEHKKSIVKNQKWLENLKVPSSDYRKQIEIRETRQRKLIKEIKPEDLREEMKTDLAKFYTEKTMLNWDKRRGDISDTKEDKRLVLNALDRAISKIAGLLYETTDASERSGYLDDIEGILQGAKL